MAGDLIIQGGGDLLDGSDASAADALVSRLHSTIENYGHQKVLPVAMTAGERSEVQERQRLLTIQLRPMVQTDREKLADGLKILFAGFPSLHSMDADSKRKMVAAYVMHLLELPLFSVLAAMDDVRRGRVKGVSPEFPPTSIRIFQEAEKRLETMRESHARAEILLNAKVAKVPASEEFRERAGRELKELAAGMRANDEARLLKERTNRAADGLGSNDRFMMREYHRRGIEPVFYQGRMVSPWLLDKVDAGNIERTEAKARYDADVADRKTRASK